MSVRLEPANLQPKLAETEDYEGVDGYWDIQMSNGTWARMTKLLTREERQDAWNHCHDGQLYNSTQLELIAMRLEGKDRDYFAEDLMTMAKKHGGCVVC